MIQKFEFNPFSENTYVISDETKQCIIIDPGCYYPQEKETLIDYIEKNQLTPVRLINTHCHIDHVLGNKFIAEKYNLKLEAHREEQVYLDRLVETGAKYGVPIESSPNIEKFLKENDLIEFGNTQFKVLFAPGHSLASIVLYNPKDNYAIVGDVIFHRSIGRTDLPGGDFNTLERSIKDKIYSLPTHTVLHPGHGDETTVGEEKVFNPFVKMG